MATHEGRGGQDAPLHADLTLNEIVARRPEAAGILLELGFDTCCGGARTLLEAAHGFRMSPEGVLRRIAGDGDG